MSPGRSAAPTTRRDVQKALAVRLGSAVEARWMVEEVLGTAPASSLVDHDALTALSALADRRREGEPLQYVLGSWAFRTLEVTVDRRALIPRPETEQVVEAALAELRRLAPDRSAPTPSDLVAADLGTGSGVIALSLALEGGATVWATDADPEALALAEANRSRVGADHPAAARVELVSGRWYEALPAALRGRLDLIVANPPYVAEAEWSGLDPQVRQEPRQALVAADGSDGTPGLADVEAVLVGAPEWLRHPGAVVVELAPHQAEPAAALARRTGLHEVRLVQDLAGRDRAVVGRV